jgi:hypothetical protein
MFCKGIGTYAPDMFRGPLRMLLERNRRCVRDVGSCWVRLRLQSAQQAELVRAARKWHELSWVHDHTLQHLPQPGEMGVPCRNPKLLR